MAGGSGLARLRAMGKFLDPDFAADGAARAVVPFARLDVLWVNTGTLCNIECRHCYIESSPTNDRLAYLTFAEFAPFLEEACAMGAAGIGFTGGEPFMNPDLLSMAGAALDAGLRVLILTNAMRPAMRPAARAELRRLIERRGARLALRVSLDHHSSERHDEERGVGAFDISLAGLKAFVADGARVSVAGRSVWGEGPEAARAGYAALFARHEIPVDAGDPEELVLFPEMDDGADTPEITTQCWSLLKKNPVDVMCATSRMVIKRKGKAPSVVACTLIVDDPQFELGASLKDAARQVKLNHPHCSRFCVLGGARCSR
ncbi:MAG: radical SAM protein [Parvularculaceae bacterium]|nr:radical SAM protein [Parvularculaceae bacterium]